VVDDIVHYCVANMPGAVARTSTYALNNVTLPHALRMAKLGWKEAMRENAHLAEGLNVHAGKVTYKAVADELGYAFQSVADVLAA
jgi:alanine dehydrogenase